MKLDSHFTPCKGNELKAQVTKFQEGQSPPEGPRWPVYGHSLQYEVYLKNTDQNMVYKV